MFSVSVIIPSFNRSTVIARAIDSVLNQSYKNFELIIIDDGSTDSTDAVVESFIKNDKIKYFRQPNLGVSAARNLGASKASGDWLAFLDSDDEWHSDKLLTQVNFLKVNESLKIAYTDEIWIRNGVKVNKKLIHQKFGGWIFDKCVHQCFIAPASVILSSNLFFEMGGFDRDFKVCEDYDLWLKISSLYEVGFISLPLISKYGGHPDQLSTQFVAMDLWRLKSLARILSIRNLSEDHSQEVIEAINKKASILVKGFLKHGNSEAIKEIESILSNLPRMS